MNYKHYFIFALTFIIPMGAMLFVINILAVNQKAIIAKQAEIVEIMQTRNVRWERMEAEIREMNKRYVK